jgi:DNA repair exonuclease SbcCD nuclease subunit
MNLEEFKVPTKYIKFNNFFLVSDLHFGVRNNSLEWLQNQLNFFRQFYIPYLKENVKENDCLFILGDTFDSRQLLDITVLNNVIDLFIDLSNILPIHCIIGNHDISKRAETDINSLKPFGFIPNVYVYEKPVVITNNTSSILLLPWIGDKEKEENYAKANKTEYIFAHTDITGFKYDNFKEIKKGVDFIKMKHIKRLFSGHIHKRQEFNNKFIYIGSPYHTKRSDIGNQKGVYKFNPDKNEIEFTKNDISSVFQKIKLEDILEYKLKDSYKIFENNYTDIIVPDRFIQLFNLTKFIEILKGCKYKKIETIGEKKKLDESLNSLSEAINITDILSLLEISIQDLGHQSEMLIKLKLLNKKYYDKASKDEIE